MLGGIIGKAVMGGAKKAMQGAQGGQGQQQQQGGGGGGIADILKKMIGGK